MNEALVLVKQFADEIGRSVDYAWPLMVQRHWFSCVFSVSGAFLALLGLGTAAFFIQKKVREHVVEKPEDASMLPVMATFLWAIYLTAALVMFNNVISPNIAGIFYPEGDLLSRYFLK